MQWFYRHTKKAIVICLIVGLCEIAFLRWRALHPQVSLAPILSAVSVKDALTRSGAPPVIIDSSDDDSDKNGKLLVAKKPASSVTAASYLVGNMATGELYLWRDADHIFPIASVSKLITALITREVFTGASSTIRVTDKALEAYGTYGNLLAGEVFTPEEISYPLILESSNDAADAIAYEAGYDLFMSTMNGRVAELGMEHTTFADPSGLNPQNVSSARDLFTLTKYLYAKHRPLIALTRTPQYSLATTSETEVSTSTASSTSTSTDIATTTTRIISGHNGHIFINTNPFVFDTHFIGGKTGRTPEAKEVMVSMFEYQIGRSTYPIAVIVLHSDVSARQIDTSILISRFLGCVEDGCDLRNDSI